MTIIDSGIASPTRANAPTAIHGSLMRSVSLCGLEDSVLRVVESGGGNSLCRLFYCNQQSVTDGSVIEKRIIQISSR